MAKLCPKCGKPLDANGFCESCGMTINVYEKIKDTSKVLYNQGLQKAKIRDLSGAIDLLNRSIRLDKENMEARNLLGLIFFEIGETVAALQQWVISKNLKPDNNEAQYFISKIQNNQSFLDKLNTAIKKYNQSLTYIGQNSVDLAIIQLKKVISLNPKFVKAYCLLALCYFKEEQTDKARKTLIKVLTIDQSNYVARKYMEAFNTDVLSTSDFAEEISTEASMFSGPSLSNDKLNLNNAMFQFVAMLVGVGIGLSVMLFLVMPSRIQEKDQEMSKVVTQVNDLEVIRIDLQGQISDLELEIISEETQSQSLTEDLSESKSQLDEITELVKALELYVSGELFGAANSLFDIDISLLSDDVAATYQSFTTEIYPVVAEDSWEEGFSRYQVGKYSEGIELLETSYKFEKNDYYSDETLYFLARCYYKLEENDKALPIFKKMLEEYPDASRKADAQYFVNILSE